VRPTVFAVPTRDEGQPEDLLPRLEKLTAAYCALIEDDELNKVLGEPEDYYQLYSREQLLALAECEQVAVPRCVDEWMIPVAKYLDLNKIKYPLIVVQEYGWNIFRLAASATLALDAYDHAHVYTKTTVKQVSDNTPTAHSHAPVLDASATPRWRVDYQAKDGREAHVDVDYLVNACGFETGIIDDMVGVDVTRMVEFKSSYITHWGQAGGQIPEIIIYGVRGTPEGMAQLTPYPDGYFQIHGMSKFITLFDDGLVASSKDSAQPILPEPYLHYIKEGWDKAPLQSRSQQAIDYVSEFVPTFNSARTVGNALYGAQQIPGEDDTLRVADVCLYTDKRYARAENVKASSTLLAADEIVGELQKLKLIAQDLPANQDRYAHEWEYLVHTDEGMVDAVARTLASKRGFPTAMARVNHSLRELSLASLTPFAG